MVIDEVAGQHITLILPLIPVAMPQLCGADGFFRLRDLFRAEPAELEISAGGLRAVPVIRYLEAVSRSAIWKNLPRGWGIMADDWLAGVYAAILLKVALHFSVL